MRSRKQKYKHKFRRVWYTGQNLAQSLEKENLCIYFAREFSIDPFVFVSTSQPLISFDY